VRVERTESWESKALFNSGGVRCNGVSFYWEQVWA